MARNQPPTVPTPDQDDVDPTQEQALPARETGSHVEEAEVADAPYEIRADGAIAYFTEQASTPGADREIGTPSE